MYYEQKAMVGNVNNTELHQHERKKTKKKTQTKQQKRTKKSKKIKPGSTHTFS